MRFEKGNTYGRLGKHKFSKKNPEKKEDGAAELNAQIIDLISKNTDISELIAKAPKGALLNYLARLQPKNVNVNMPDITIKLDGCTKDV